jgi:hypothetical protein
LVRLIGTFFRMPAGLAVGLALKDALRTSGAIRPVNPGPPLPGDWSGDSAIYVRTEP